MAMFDYKNYSMEESTELMLTSHKLAAYANMSGFLGIRSSRELVQGFADLFPNGAYANTIDTELPKGWRELTPQELGLPDSAVDASGHYIIESPITGLLPTGPQTKLLGEFQSLRGVEIDGLKDWLVFVNGLFADEEELFASASQQVNDVVIAGDAFHITVERTDLITIGDQSQFWV